MIKAAIFDMDGTLVDSETTAVRVIGEVFASFGTSLPTELSRVVVGRKWTSAIEIIERELGGLPVPQEQITEKIRTQYEKSLKSGKIVEVPGAVSAVRALAAEMPVALVSGSLRSEIAILMTSIGLVSQFRVSLGAEDYPRSKPAPDGFLLACERLSVSPRDTVVFEDSVAGIDAGLAAGSRVVAVSHSNHFGHDQSRAHHIVRDLTGVSPSFLKKIFG